MIELESIIKSLLENNVKFVIIGGVAIIHYGSAYVTQDFDFCYSRDETNFTNIVKALVSHHPTLRSAPENLPFLFDEETLRRGNNFTLSTDLGDVDILGSQWDRRLC
jgi:hypothetical protein